MKTRTADFPSEPPFRRSGRRTAAAIVVGLALAPLCYEGTAVVVTRWQALMGRVPPEARTPVYDALAEALDDGSRWAGGVGQRMIRIAGENPRWTTGLAFFWAVLGGGLLMRSR